MIDNQRDYETEDAGDHQFADMDEKIAGQQQVDSHQDDPENSEQHRQTFASDKIFHHLTGGARRLVRPSGGVGGLAVNERRRCLCRSLLLRHSREYCEFSAAGYRCAGRIPHPVFRP